MRWKKSGVLEHKSGNFFETRKHREKVTVEGGPIGSYKRSFERYHPGLPWIWISMDISMDISMCGYET